MSVNRPIFYPQVSTVGPSREVLDTNRKEKGPAGISNKPSEFDQVLGQELNLEQVREPLKFSNHATKRLMERGIKLDPILMQKINSAVDQAAAKGVEETLVLTPDAALIVNIKNRTIITAIDRQSLTGNVFTNIDGAVIV